MTIGARPTSVLLAVVAAVVAGILALTVVRAVQASGSAGLGYPPVPADARPARLLPPVAVVSSGPYAAEHLLPGGSPATYDPCRPMHYVVNPASMPDAVLPLLADAVAAVSAATGLALVDDGRTSEPLSLERGIVQRERYGNRWAPVLIGFSDARGYPSLAGDVVGVGGSSLVQPRGTASARLVSGQVALDVDALSALVARGRSDQVRAIIMHELAHVVGLDHVEDPAQLMYPRNVGLTSYGPGDLEGLAILGNGVCHTDT